MTEIKEATEFYRAEEYHQQVYTGVHIYSVYAPHFIPDERGLQQVACFLRGWPPAFWLLPRPQAGTSTCPPDVM